jgi:beta-galactosidase
LRVFNASDVTIPVKPSDMSMDAAAVPQLKAFERATLPIFAGAGPASATAPELGLDGDVSCYAWYHADMKAAQAGPATLSVGSVKDNCVVYVNGTYAGELHYINPPRGRRGAPAVGPPAATLNVNLNAGDNQFAFFVSHHGRDKAYNVIGNLDDTDPKGLRGDVTVTAGDVKTPLADWTMKGGVGTPDNTLSYAPLATDGDPMPTFYRATFDAQPPAATGAHPIYRVTFAGLSRGSIWLNGHNLGRYPEKIPGLNTVYLPECWIKAGANELGIFDEKGASPSQVKIVPDTVSSYENIVVSQ